MDGKYINLITFTKNGDSIATPLWFVENDEKLYVITKQKRYKIRRIKNNPQLKIAQCNFLGKVKGSYIEGEARIISDDLYLSIRNMFKKKYFLGRFMNSKDKGENKLVCIEISMK